jgi:hypothetical protein
MPHTPSGGGPPDGALSVNDNIDECLPVDRQGHGPPQIRIVEGRSFPVHDHIARDVSHEHVADRLRHLVLDVLQLRHRHAEIGVFVTGHEG